MRCPICGFDNPEGMKFCGECAAPLPNRCPHCSFENPPRFKFCGECATPLTGGEKGKRGKGERENLVSGLRTSDPGLWTPPHLAERIQAEREALEARKAPDGERKTITALFADLAGFTALAHCFFAPDIWCAERTLPALEIIDNSGLGITRTLQLDQETGNEQRRGTS